MHLPSLLLLFATSISLVSAVPLSRGVRITNNADGTPGTTVTLGPDGEDVYPGNTNTESIPSGDDRGIGKRETIENSPLLSRSSRGVRIANNADGTAGTTVTLGPEGEDVFPGNTGDGEMVG